MPDTDTLLFCDAKFYAFEISDNISLTPEGFLLCLNVPIARTGVQRYMGSELNIRDRWNELIKVYRLEDDVFHPQALASFEGKPVTNDHPVHGLVNPSNANTLVKGHLQNVRRVDNFIIADILITDQILINQVKDGGKREVSCGYQCNWEPYQDGYRQFNITGNHLAIVVKGRAGSKVAIKDSLKGDRKPMDKSQLQAQIIVGLVKDGATADQVAEAISMFQDAGPVTSPEKPKDDGGFMANLFAKLLTTKDTKVNDEEPDEKEEKEEAKDSALNTRLAAIEDTLKALVPSKRPKGGIDDILAMDEEAFKKWANDEDEDEKEEAKDEDIDEKEKEAAMDEEPDEKEDVKDSSKVVLKHFRKIMDKLTVEDQALVRDALNKSLAKPSVKGSYGNILRAQQSHVRVADSDITNLGKQWAQKNNPHYKKA